MREWTPAQLNRYNEAFAKGLSGSSYIDLVRFCTEDCSFNSPATEKDISRIEHEIGNSFPPDLRKLYLETNGIQAIYGNHLILSLEEVISKNSFLRTDEGITDLYMPFDNLLFFGSAGNGDLFGYPIHMDGSFADDIFGWDHESDSRMWVANNLVDLLVRYTLRLLIDASISSL